jgi:pantetheine-phosphate adenylyltransferase
MTKSCIYSGSFDPVTKGHIDIVRRATGLFHTVYVGVLNNTSKKYMFSLKTRLEMMKRSVASIQGVQVVSSEGLLVDLMRRVQTNVILRGLRSNADLELEQQLAEVNAKLLPGTETLILLSDPGMTHVSSTIVRELISYGADISGYVPNEIIDMIDGRSTK